tara:strand:- start:165 stop:641 length:477 start_codon:yes stop_codon:yes gene_type:complete
MDNQKTLLTASVVGIGGVALAFLGHNYLMNNGTLDTSEDKAASEVENKGFFHFLFNNDNDAETVSNDAGSTNDAPHPNDASHPNDMSVFNNVSTTNDNVKTGNDAQNIKLNVVETAQSPEFAADAVKKNVDNTLRAFSGFFRQEESTPNAEVLSELDE